jgi:hypothetical protein
MYLRGNSIGTDDDDDDDDDGRRRRRRRQTHFKSFQYIDSQKRDPHGLDWFFRLW